jgi:hypothetical protein
LLYLGNPQRLLLNEDLSLLFNKAPAPAPPLLMKQPKSASYQSAPNLTAVSTASLQRSKSTLPLQEKPPSRMESIRRALTTTRRRNLRTSSTLHISLPDQLYTPPLSPPTSTSLPTDLPKVQHHQQDCILRHMALLYLELPIDEAEDILDLKKASNLWNKLKTHILTPTTEINPQQLHQSPLPSPPTTMSIFNLTNMNTDLAPFEINDQSVFFERWRTVCPSIISCFSAEAQIPIFLKHCVLTLIDQDINTEGIFRKNGNIRGLKDMCDILEEGYQDQHDWMPFFKQQPIIQLAAFVKKFLRELPEPLLTFKLHPVFMRYQRLETLHWAICALPKANRDILLLVLALLNWVAKHAEDNKMDAENLARVMAPNILYGKVQDKSICHEEICIVATMIENYEKLIKVK